MTDTPSHQLIRHALRIGALELLPDGRKLKSGRISPYFFNSGKFTTGTDLSVLANAYAAVLNRNDIPFDVVFGPAYKGITLAAITAMQYASRYQTDVSYCFNRKEVKDHGEGGLLVGANLKDKRVAVVDDVITSGETKEEALGIVKDAGGTVTQVVLAFDRQERGQGKLSAAGEFAEKFGIPVFAAANLDNLLEVLDEQPSNMHIIERILAYRVMYGVQ